MLMLQVKCSRVRSFKPPLCLLSMLGTPLTLLAPVLTTAVDVR